MNRNRKIIFASFLLIVAWPFGVDAAKSPPLKEVKVKVNVKEPVATVAGPTFAEKSDLLGLIAEDNASSDIVLDAAWGERNPFDNAAIQALPIIVPVQKEEKDVRVFNLAGILWTGNRPSAIINAQVVGVGDVILRKTVKEIKENRVTLVEGDNQLDLLLHK